MKKFFVSFADSKFAPTLSRLRKQVEEMGCFERILIMNEKDLDTSFRKKIKPILSRGYGYWIWKPYIILKAMELMEEGDELLYCDAGCHLNSAGRERLLEYFRQVSGSSVKVGGFEIGAQNNERRYTKMDLLVYFGVQGNDALLNRGQICATHVLLQKCTASEEFIRKWYELAADLHNVDDSPSILPNFPEFVVHRYDQSIFSLLCKTRGAVILPGNEVWPADDRSWELLDKFPIHDRRDKQFSKIGYIKFKLACCWNRVVKLFKR